MEQSNLPHNQVLPPSVHDDYAEEDLFALLPAELMQKIFSSLTVQELERCLYVSRRWFQFGTPM